MIAAKLTSNYKVSIQFLCAAMLVFCMFISSSYAQLRENAQENNQKLDVLKKQIEKTKQKAQNLDQQARDVGQDISNIQQDLIKTASNIHAIEGQIFDKEASLQDLKDSEQDLEKRLKDKNFEMASTLGAMQRLSLQKTNVMAFKPGKAIDTLRTTSLLKVILPELKDRAALLNNDLTTLNSVRKDIVIENIELRNQLTRLVISNGEIDDLLKRRVERQKDLEKSTRQEREKLKKFAATAKNIQELVDQIDLEIALREEAAKRAAALLREKPNNKTGIASMPMPAGTMSISKAKGSLPIPARGRINQVFGQLLATGQRSKGITINTRAGATVIAPHEGRIVFAGKFRTYGQLLIISHGEGYHTLLAGMENINSIVGQWILKGEPVGQMAANTAQNNINTSNSRQKLYVEFRQKGKPINPLPWIIAMDRKG